MNRNTIIGLLLIFAIFIGFSAYNNSKIDKQKQQSKSVTETKDTTRTPSTANLEEKEPVQQDSNTIQPAQNQEIAQKSFFSTTASDKEYTVETDIAKYSFSSKGGYITRVELKDVYRYTPKGAPKQPLILFEGNSNKMNLALLMKDQSTIHTANCHFVVENGNDALHVSGKDKRTLSLRLYPVLADTSSHAGDSTSSIDKGSYIEYLYTFNANDYRFGFKVNMVNMQKYLYPNNTTFTLSWNADLNTVEKNYTYERDVTTLYYMDNLRDVDHLEERASERKEYSTPLKWVSFKQQFFTSVIIADSAEFKSGDLAVTVPDKAETHLLKKMSTDLEFDLGSLDQGSFDMSLYFGPNQFKLLNKYDLKLERQVPLGWGFFLLHWINRGAVIPIFNWLEAYGINYGIIILILTIILKLVLFPIAYKTYLSSARMRVLKPDIDALAAKFPKPEDAMKKQQATMTLYKKAGINPMSGCLPMLLQLPILIAMFRFFPSAYELRQKSFLWAEDLSSYDSVLDLGFNIPFYGDHVSLFTLLMTISTLIYTWLNNKMMAAGAGDQQKMMKIMMYIMPIIFLGVFNNFSSALTYYYLLVNLITFLQMWIFRMAIDEKKIHQKIQLNMTKPVKKSKWQQRLEQLEKQQQHQQKLKK